MEDFLIERFPDEEAYSGAAQNRCAVSVSVIKLNCGRMGVTIELCVPFSDAACEELKKAAGYVRERI